MNIEELINDYQNGMSIYDVCEKYHIGKLKVKKILSENGIEIRKKGKQPMDKNSFVVADYRVKKYKEHDGFHYVAVDRNDGTSYNDYMNNAGLLTNHIEKVYGVKIPTLYDRRKYYMKTGNYWWEQWFNIVEEKNVEHSIKCPYCNWATNDVDNKSGAFTHHLTSIHHMTVKEHLEKYPENYNYFKKQAKAIEKEIKLKDPNNYVICPICGKKMPKITYSHLRNSHKIGMVEFKKQYPKARIMSNDMIEQAQRDMKLGNLVVSKSRFISTYEKEIGEFITNLGIEHNANRQILIGREIDILVPSVNIGIEFNGLKWHTEFFGKKNHKYHIEKTLQCNEKGYGLIHIFEDEYVEHKDIVFTKLKHILRKDYDLPKIAGRKIQVKEIYSNDAKEFFTKYHIQGFYKSSVYIGGFYENKLVAVMSFKNGNIKNENWELVRFATDYHYIYQGVASKMFTYFIRKYEPNAIVSFADRRWTPWSTNNLYTKLGFTLESITKPDYRYYNEKIDKYKRVHKMSMCKSILNKKYGFPMTMTELEMTKELGYDRIWDCGLFKYVWKKEDE